MWCSNRTTPDRVCIANLSDSAAPPLLTTRFRQSSNSYLNWRFPIQASWSVMAKTVLITGGTRGLGLAIAEALVKSGYQPVALARTRAEPPISIPFVPFDLAETAAIPALVKTLRND